ncbi:hypothetical protein [Arthrobacter sp. UYCo732]|uniref:hypothetical protein n=1 Tax=Arthrobacter sp. UYCo732 TaxID=3156336 RepID=UPI0033943178
MEIYAESALHNTETLPYGDDTFQVVEEAEGGVIAYCHRGSAERIVAALRAADTRIIPASTLGELIKALESCSPDAPLYVDYRGHLIHPGIAMYYRGYHDDLAISPDGTGDDTVSDLTETLRDILRDGFTRPGTETAAYETTEVWIAKLRDASNLHVTGIRVERYRVVILTDDRGR